MKKILILVGHHSKKSFSAEVGKKYLEGALDSSFDAEIVFISDLKFNPVLEEGYKKIQPLEKDLVDVQKKISDSNHLVFVYPVWWGGLPAKFKGFVDRVFLPGFAFKFKDKSILPKRLLNGKSARVIMLKGGSKIFYFGSLAYPGMIMRRFILNFCGIFPVRIKSYYNSESMSRKRADRIFRKVYCFGKKGK